MKFAVGPASTLRWYQLQTEHMGYLALGYSTPGIAVSILYLGTCAVSLKGPASEWDVAGLAAAGSAGGPQGGEAAP